MKDRSWLLTGLLCLVFVALGGCLFLAGEGMLRAEGVTVETTAAGTLYRPMAISAQSVPLYEEPAGGAHTEHESAVTVGGKCAVALLLADKSEGAAAMATELARRGVTVLTAASTADANAAWQWLTGQPYARAYAAAIIAGRKSADEALALAETFSATDHPAATVILLGGADTLAAAAAHPGRNLLLLMAEEPDGADKAALLGADHDRKRDFTGYFSDGTARAVTRVKGGLRFSSREVLVRALDWQGSSLGHAVSLHDDDLAFRRIAWCRTGAALCLLPAALFAALRLADKRSKQKKR